MKNLPNAKKLFTKEQLDEIMRLSYELKEQNPKLSMIDCVSLILLKLYPNLVKKNV